MEGPPKYVCFKCRNKVPTTDLEAIFHEQLKGLFFSRDDLAAYTEQADSVLVEKRTLRHTLETKRDKFRVAMDKIMRLYVDGNLS